MFVWRPEHRVVGQRLPVVREEGALAVDRERVEALIRGALPGLGEDGPSTGTACPPPPLQVLAEELTSAGAMSWTVFRERAVELGMTPDGALYALNDWVEARGVRPFASRDVDRVVVDNERWLAAVEARRR
jgi:hypothetical protein